MKKVFREKVMVKNIVNFEFYGFCSFLRFVAYNLEHFLSPNQGIWNQHKILIL
jgi:hypothetical protein